MSAESPSHASEAGSGFEPNSVTGTLIVAIVLCLVCSLVVSTAAVSLKPLQETNKQNKMRKNVLIAAGLWDDSKHTDADIPRLFEPIDIELVNLPRAGEKQEAGTLNQDLDPKTYNQRKAARDPAESVTIPPELDVAGIKRREKVSAVYLLHGPDGKLSTIVLPVYGKGLWSTLYGFLALEGDARTVKGITFYEHAETPGLGGEVDNPKWKAQWHGKEAVDAEGDPVLDVTKPGAADGATEVDGLSGATMTSNGVENTVRYWLGSDAFEPYLQSLRHGENKPDDSK